MPPAFSSHARVLRRLIHPHSSATAPALPALAVLLIFAFAGRLPAADALTETKNPAGIWKWVSSDRDGERYQSILKLELTNGVLAGTLIRREGENAIIENPKFDGGTISFHISRKRESRTTLTIYRARIEGDLLKGTVESSYAGQRRTRDWQAQRDKPVAVGSVAGTWHWTFTTPAGQTFKPKMHLTQEGERVTGTVIWGENEHKISEGRLSEGQLFIKILGDRDGRIVTTKYDGKLEAGVIKGTIESDWTGESRISDWEAKRETAPNSPTDRS